MIGRMPGAQRGFVKARRAVDAVAIEQRERGVAEIGRAIDERLGQRRALEKAEGGRGVELDVHGRRHAASRWTRRTRWVKTSRATLILA